MSTTSKKIQRIARRLDEAARTGPATPQLTGDDAPDDLEQAYAVQRELVALRLKRGARRTGIKMGFTSRAKMVQMGVSDMIWGRLSSDMLIEEGGTMDLAHYVHPRVEPEIAFLLRRPLEGAVTMVEALDAVEAIAPALEVIDSRYADFKFSLNDVVADNASSSGYVIGPWHRPDIDFQNLGLVMSVDGRAAELGTTAAILGHPLRSLVAAARVTAAAGERLEAGHLVMAGGATAAVALRAGMHVRMEMQSLGAVAFSVAKEADQ